MEKTIKVKPNDFSTSSEKLISKLGLKESADCKKVSYCPVPSSGPTPYSIEVDLSTMEVIRRIYGVMPNAIYCSNGGEMLSESEFRRLKYTLLSKKTTYK